MSEVVAAAAEVSLLGVASEVALALVDGATDVDDSKIEDALVEFPSRLYKAVRDPESSVATLLTL